MDPACESGLVVLVPEADVLLESFRRQYDSYASLGVPAHVTVLYPFRPPAQLDAEVMQKLQELFSTFRSFSCSFAETRHFSNVLYLAPAPDEPFRQLTELVARHFPDTPPYGGKFADIIPHLTIAEASDAGQLQQITDEFERLFRGRLPLRTDVTEVALLDNESDDWHIRARFLLDAKAVATCPNSRG
jgi:2'-5' RNA ligase